MSNQSKKKDGELKELRRIAGLLKNNLPRQNNERQGEPQHESGPSVSKFGLTYEPAGGLIPWVFGIGIGAALNCLSADPRILYVTWIALTVWIIWVFYHKHWLLKVVFFAICLSFLLPLEKFINFKMNESAINSSESSISVMPYAGTDKINPLDTDFSVHNSGSFTITNMVVIFTIVHADRGKDWSIGDMTMAPNRADRLEPGKDFMIQSGFYHYIHGGFNNGKISISVSFEDVRRPKYTITRTFEFWLKISDEGPRWLESN